jgi:hypothetical protein
MKSGHFKSGNYADKINKGFMSTQPVIMFAREVNKLW